MGTASHGRERRPGDRPHPIHREDYTAAEVEYLRACDAYRRRCRLRFMHACDYLYVILEMGYSPNESPPGAGGPDGAIVSRRPL